MASGCALPVALVTGFSKSAASIPIFLSVIAIEVFGSVISVLLALFDVFPAIGLCWFERQLNLSVVDSEYVV